MDAKPYLRELIHRHLSVHMSCGDHRKFLSDVDYERPPRGLGEFIITSVEDVPSYFEPGDAWYRAIPVYSCNPVHQHLWPLTRGETVIQFTVEVTPF